MSELVSPVGKWMYSLFYLAAPRGLVASGPYFILVGPVEYHIGRQMDMDDHPRQRVRLPRRPNCY